METKTRAGSSAAGVIVVLLSKLSSFWTVTGLSEVIGLCIRYERFAEVDTVSRAIVKNIPPEVSIPTMTHSWENYLASETMVCFQVDVRLVEPHFIAGNWAPSRFLHRIEEGPPSREPTSDFREFKTTFKAF